jgi:hypothetical protein
VREEWSWGALSHEQSRRREVRPSCFFPRIIQSPIKSDIISLHENGSAVSVSLGESDCIGATPTLPVVAIGG